MALQVGIALWVSQTNTDPRATYHSVIFPPQWESSPPSFEGWLGRYRRLNNWDSFHYLSIAKFGYRKSHLATPIPETIHSYQGNEAFFPAYPLLARAVTTLISVPPDIGLLLAAQLMAVLTWTYFLLILRELQKSPSELSFLSSLLFLFRLHSI